MREPSFVQLTIFTDHENHVKAWAKGKDYTMASQSADLPLSLL